jgi:hypothetical protein
MTAGRRDNLIGSVRFGSVRQEHSAIFSVCQVISHKKFRKFIAGDGANCALPSAFLYLEGGPYGNAKAAVNKSLNGE